MQRRGGEIYTSDSPDAFGMRDKELKAAVWRLFLPDYVVKFRIM